MGWFDKFMPWSAKAREKSATEAVNKEHEAIVSVEAQYPTDKRVYNEYFITEPGEDNHYHWLCRVYGPDGMRVEKRGLHLTEAGARLQAMTYANKTKADIRAAL